MSTYFGGFIHSQGFNHHMCAVDSQKSYLVPWPSALNSFSSVSLIFCWAFPLWYLTIMSNPVCSSFYSPLPSPFHTQNNFPCPVSLPLSSFLYPLNVLSSESWNHSYLFSQVSKFLQAFLFQSVLTAKTGVQAFILLHLNCSHSFQALPQPPALSHIPLPVKSSLNTTFIVSLP